MITLTEEQFLQQVKQVARFLGWLTYHTRDSRGSEPGFPDLVFCHPYKGQYFMAELKAPDGELNPHQVKWIQALQDARIEVHVWKPANWESIISRLQSS